MKLCVSNIAWSREENQLFYEKLQKEGITGLEIAPLIALENGIYATNEEIELFLKELKSYGLTPVSLQSLLFGIPRVMALFEGDEKREALKQTLTEVILFASKIKANNLVFGSPKNRCLHEMQEYPKGVALFRELGDFAAKHGVVLAMEPNAKAYGTNFATTLQETIDFISDVDSEGIRLNFDFGSFVMENENEESFIQAIPYMNHVHLSAPMLDTLQNLNPLLVKQCFRHLKASTYTGYVSIEMKCPNQNGETTIQSAIQFLKEVMN